jgi:hypothetical protein
LPAAHIQAREDLSGKVIINADSTDLNSYDQIADLDIPVNGRFGYQAKTGIAFRISRQADPDLEGAYQGAPPSGLPARTRAP